MATTRGVKIFSLDAGLECVFEHHKMGACRIAEMLFRSSLLVVVGAGVVRASPPSALSAAALAAFAAASSCPFVSPSSSAFFAPRPRADRPPACFASSRVLPAALSASCAFMLPVATAPNAIVFGTRKIGVQQMVREGFALNLIGAAVITAVVYIWLA